jgi:hypothetical protein
LQLVVEVVVVEVTTTTGVEVAVLVVCRRILQGYPHLQLNLIVLPPLE